MIDAIFGSGLNRPVTGLAARIIKQMNASVNRVVAVDIPSGLAGRIIPGTIPKPLFVQSIPLLFSSRSLPLCWRRMKSMSAGGSAGYRLTS